MGTSAPIAGAPRLLWLLPALQLTLQRAIVRASGRHALFRLLYEASIHFLRRNLATVKHAWHLLSCSRRLLYRTHLLLAFSQPPAPSPQPPAHLPLNASTRPRAVLLVCWTMCHSIFYYSSFHRRGVKRLIGWNGISITCCLLNSLSYLSNRTYHYWPQPCRRPSKSLTPASTSFTPTLFLWLICCLCPSLQYRL